MRYDNGICQMGYVKWDMRYEAPTRPLPPSPSPALIPLSPTANLNYIPQRSSNNQVRSPGSPTKNMVPSGSAPTESSVNRALILVVERNPIVQRLERYFLEQAGYTVEFANDGLSAFRLAIELKPRILVTEILVPELDGLNLCRKIKSNPETSHILVLIFSHLHAEDRAVEVGADAFLVKPLDEQSLIETVEKLLSAVRSKEAEQS